jgi:inositol monophosphatase 3
MVGIAIDGESVAGVIHYPFSDETIWGWVGHGNNVLDQSEKSPDNSIIMSRSHTGSAESQTNSLFKDAKVFLIISYKF